jgi:hypothetical protein
MAFLQDESFTGNRCLFKGKFAKGESSVVLARENSLRATLKLGSMAIAFCMTGIASEVCPTLAW